MTQKSSVHKERETRFIDDYHTAVSCKYNTCRLGRRGAGPLVVPRDVLTSFVVAPQKTILPAVPVWTTPSPVAFIYNTKNRVQLGKIGVCVVSSNGELP